ncbi:MAG: Rpn family recombination-promoting nuclease/putative transposase [Lachnospiraceae bacterium]|nr:Rpn family recombination-promoting nuclease/putative transposase [Lachnospiraceae bacterium]
MSEFLMKPKIDFAFKEIMMNEKARIGFLSAILKLKPENIKKSQILNTNLRKIHKDEKQGILDVRILMNTNIEIDIEIQLASLSVWADRSLFYLSKMFIEQISAGQDYSVFKKCVNISILDFILFQEDQEFYSCFHIWEDTRHILYTDKMEFHVLELPKLPEKLKEDNDNILLWAKFINAERKEDFDMLAEKDPYIGSAYQQLQIISQDKQKRLEYEAREKAIRDHNQLLFEAEQRGEQRGELRGEQRGEQRGIKLGEARINQLHMLLLQQKRYDDLERSVNDINYQQQLLKEYGI